MAHWQRNRFPLAWLLVAGLALYACLASAWENTRLHQAGPAQAPVTIHEERIRQLKPWLPARGEVGYITSVENERIFADEKAMRNVEYLAQYVLTQYTLAPLIVRNRPDLALVVGNFLSRPPEPGFVERHRLTVLKDFGDGLILYQGPPP